MSELPTLSSLSRVTSCPFAWDGGVSQDDRLSVLMSGADQGDWGTLSAHHTYNCVFTFFRRAQPFPLHARLRFILMSALWKHVGSLQS